MASQQERIRYLYRDLIAMPIRNLTVGEYRLVAKHLDLEERRMSEQGVPTAPVAYNETIIEKLERIARRQT